MITLSRFTLLAGALATGALLSACSEQPTDVKTAEAPQAAAEQTELKLDVQLQTPKGGVALKEWARTTGKVLLKRNDGAVLVNNPWP